MSEKKKAVKKWDKEDFLKAWIANSKMTDWKTFHGAMSNAQKSAGFGPISDDIHLALRIGSLTRHLKEAGYAAPAAPSRPRKAAKTGPTVADLGKQLKLKKLS